MTLKAVLFDFNGVILDDEPLHQQLIADLVRDQDWQPSVESLQRFCVGRSDRAGIQALLASRGQAVTETELNQLLATKAQTYHRYLADLDPLPVFVGVQELVHQLHQMGVEVGDRQRGQTSRNWHGLGSHPARGLFRCHCGC